MKRFLSLFLAAAVLISCLTITAFADDGATDNSSAFQKTTVDLLDALSYDFYNNGDLVSTRVRPTYYYSTRSTNINIAWAPNGIYEVGGFNFCLYSTVKPSSVKIIPFEGANYSLTGNYVGSDGNFHYYNSITSNPISIGKISFSISFSSVASNTTVAMVNCFGYEVNAFLVESAGLYHDVEYNDSEWYIKRISSLPEASIPHSFDYAWQINHFSAYTINIDLPVSNADCLSFNFSSLGSTVLDTGIVVGLYDGSTLINQLPIEVISGMGFSTTLVDDNKALLYTYTCNVDLSGCDLSNRIIKIKIECDSFLNDGLYHSDFNILSIAYKQETISIPWYLKFYRWISAKMTAGYQSIVDAIKGDDNSDMNQATDQMEGAANDLKESSDAFEQVETPDIDAGALTGDLTNFSVSGLAVLGVITANPYVTSLLVLVFTFALCAYIFFGKKG